MNGLRIGRRVRFSEKGLAFFERRPPCITGRVVGFKYDGGSRRVIVERDERERMIWPCEFWESERNT